MKNELPHDMPSTGRGDENYEYLLNQTEGIVELFSKNSAQAEGTMSRLVRGVTADQWEKVLKVWADKWRTVTHTPDEENPFILQP